jgi:membrane-bound lytic murein transglycosylase B
MKSRIACLFVIIILLMFPGKVWPLSDAGKRFLEERLIEKGLDKALAQSLIWDTRIASNPDVIIKNLFYSSPKGSADKPSVMKIDPKMIEEGRAFMKEHAELMAAVEKRFGTSPQIITAILIVESRLGKVTMTYGAVTAYASLAFLLDPDYLKEIQTLHADQFPQLRDDAVIARAKRRANWALDELYHLVLLARDLGVDPFSMKGSFSGALGPAQFIPSTFQTYGIDGDEDGKCDPFNMKDAKLSMGNYLKKSGWSEDASVEQKRTAIWQYNHSTVYVNTIMMLYDELRRPLPVPGVSKAPI